MNHLTLPSGLQIGGQTNNTLPIQLNNTMYNDKLYTKLLNSQLSKKRRCTKKNKGVECNKRTKKKKLI